MTLQKHTNRGRCLRAVVLAAGLLTSMAAQAQHEFLMFPQAYGSWNDLDDMSGMSPTGHHDQLDDRHSEIGIDFFLTWERGNLTFLGEFLLSDEEQDLERLQLGWRFGQQTLWVGRFHNAVGYWNENYHHGAYLQTSISRPAIVNYEEHGGILPTHQAGMQYEGWLADPAAGIGYSLSVAAGPYFNGEELHIWDILDASEGSHDLSTTLNLFREWDWGRLGFFTNFNRIPTALENLPEIDQWVTGIYVDRQWKQIRLHGSALFLSNEMNWLRRQGSYRFSNAYLQLEFQANPTVSLYTRGETSWGDEGDAYLALFPNFVRQRLLGGVRWDLFDCSALKVEISTNTTDHADYEQLSLQWSAQL